jgi:gamma-glutamylcyclotransferase (GGCT)/AIG2-like uncharacterized protein YtfP
MQNNTKSTSANKTIAVWGTLKRGQGNNRYYMSNAKFIGEDLLDNLGNNHNSIRIERNEKGLAKVEIFEVPETDYAIIDEMEKRFDYEGKLTKLESGKEAIVWFHRNQLNEKEKQTN